MNQTLVLLADVDGVGKKGDIVEVKRGYTRNFLLPQKKAKIVTKEELVHIQKEKEGTTKKSEAVLKQISERMKNLSGKRISVERKASKTGKLFAAVSKADMVKLLHTTYGVKVPENAIMGEAIKSVGLHSFKVATGELGDVGMKVAVREAK